jgi:hypothetical protein
VLVVSLAAMCASAGPAMASSWAWTGLSDTQDWSNTANWSPASPVSSATGLTFEPLPAPCAAQSSNDTCYVGANDVNGLSVNSISLDDSQPYLMTGDPIALGAGGFTATWGGGGYFGRFDVPITLTASQTWSITGGVQLAGVTGSSDALTIDFHHGASPASYGDVELDGPVDVGPLDLESGAVLMEPGAEDLDGTDDAPVTVDAGAQLSVSPGAHLGPLTVAHGGLVIQSGASTSVNGAVTLDPHSHFDAAIPASSPMVQASGNVAIGGDLSVLQSGSCQPLTAGTVYTLVSSTGTLTGTFSKVPNGAEFGTFEACPTRGTGLSTLAQINYTPHAVTATIVPAPTVAHMRSALTHVLKPKGKAATIGRLLKRGGYPGSFPALAGLFSLSWESGPKHHPVTVAIVNARFYGAQPTKFDVRLTRAGTRELRHARRLKLTAEGVFIPAATLLGDVTAHATFTLKR